MSKVLTPEQLSLMGTSYGTSASAQIFHARTGPALTREQIDSEVEKIMGSKSEGRTYDLVHPDCPRLGIDGEDDVVMVTEIRQTDRGANAAVKIELTTRGWCEYFISLQYWSMVDVFRGEDAFKSAVEAGLV